MSVKQAPPRSKRARQDSPPVSSGRGYLALTAALYPDGDAISAEILEFDIASWGHDPEQAYEMIVEAVAGDIEAAYRDSASGLDAFVRLLRSKLEIESEIKLLHTVRGVGYCLRQAGG